MKVLHCPSLWCTEVNTFCSLPGRLKSFASNAAPRWAAGGRVRTSTGELTYLHCLLALVDELSTKEGHVNLEIGQPVRNLAGILIEDH